MQLSDILSKPIISLYNGTTEGYALNGCFNHALKKLKYIIVANNENNEDEELYLLDTNNIFKFGEDAIIIKNNSSLELLSNKDGAFEYNNPINSVAYTTKGTKLGVINDVTLTDNLQIIKFHTNLCEYNANLLASFSNGTMIFQDKDIIKVSRYRPFYKKVKPLKNEQQVKIFTLPTIDNPKKYSLNEVSVQRLTGNTTLLLGRKLSKQITSSNGELIARKDSRITPKIIASASMHQKLRELALYSE